jgi:hypothetical protein
MKNREKYRDEIVKFAKCDTRDVCDFKRKEVFPHFLGKEGCDGISCSWCSFMCDLWLDEEYIEPKPKVDWDKVPVDTLVRVRDNKNGKWALRYFCEWKENGVYMTFPNGRTSKTAKYYTKEIWKYCELVEDEDGNSSI